MMKKIFLPFILILNIPISISGENLIITDQKISETIMRNHFSLSTIDELFINWETLQMLMDRIDEQLYKEPKNAVLDDYGRIIPAQPGIKLDRLKFARIFHEFYYNHSIDKIKAIPKKQIYPKVDSELLAEIRTNELGHYVTYYRETNKERSHNIALAAKAINNYVVFPGEEFSFNQVVGKRTKEKGYKRAPVIVRGELSEDIGGGICQVSSTLFNAVSLKGIQIVERYTHSRKVPYVPPGKDATVSWWGPDFIFKNVYNHPILIRATARDGRMLVRIFSSDAVERRPDST